MQDFFLLENTLAQVLEMQEEKTELEKEIQSSKSKLREERRSGKGLSEESIKLNGRYTETGLAQEMSTTENEIGRLKKKTSEQKNKLENFERDENKFKFLIGAILVICALIAALDLHGDLQKVPFICNNDEVVLASGVLDGVDDCSDGSDEIDSFWGFTRTEDFQMDVADGAWFSAIFASIVFIPVTWYVITESRNHRTLVTLMIILVGSSSVGVYSLIDVNQTWECDDGEEILRFYVSDGKRNCADGSDELKSGFWDDETTRAEGEGGDMKLANSAYSFWALAVMICGIWWLLKSKIFEIPDTQGNSKKEAEQTKRTLSSRKGKHTRLKNNMNRLNELPNLIELSNKSAFALEGEIANAKERVKSLGLAISDEMEKVSHMIPYSNS